MRQSSQAETNLAGTLQTVFVANGSSRDSEPIKNMVTAPLRGQAFSNVHPASSFIDFAKKCAFYGLD